MSNSTPLEITHLLRAWSDGDQAALDQLVPLVQRHLHKLAHRHISREHPGHILQSTALVHEAFIRLFKSPIDWQDRQHFFSLMSLTMRRILVDLARAHQHQIQVKDAARVPTEDARGVMRQREPRLLAIDDALQGLEKLYPRPSKVVELGFYGGFTQAEIAEALGVHIDTVRRDQKFALAWIRSQMQGASSDAPAHTAAAHAGGK